MEGSSAKRSPVGAFLAGLITGIILFFFNYFAIGMVILAAVAVGAVFYLRPRFASSVLLAFLLIPLFSIFPSVQPLSAPVPIMVVALAFLAVLTLNMIDWFGSLIGIWLGLALYSPYVIFLVIPIIVALSAYSGMKKAGVAAVIFSIFGAIFMNAGLIGIALPPEFLFYTTFFPTIGTISGVPFASGLLFYLFGSNWQQSLNVGSSAFVLNNTPIYFLAVAAVIIPTSFYLATFIRRSLNPALSKLTAAVIGSALGALLYGTFYPLLISVGIVFLLGFSFTALNPLLGSKPKLSARGVSQLLNKPAIMEAGRAKNGAVMVERNPSKAFSTMSYWDRAKGLDDVKEDLFKSVILPMNKRTEAEKYGVKPVKGILLYGPPGTGKTILLRGLASKLPMTYVEVNPGSLLSKWYGESEHRMKEVAETAIQDAPSILAIDELDSIGKERTAYSHDDVTPRVLNVLLMDMDKIFQGNADVIVMATTNKPQLLDKALLRSGRFDKIIYVGPPDAEAREEIFRLYLGGKGKILDESIDYRRLAEMSERFTGADIENLVNLVMSSAFYNKVLENKEQRVDQQVLENAIKATRPSIDLSMLEEYDLFRLEFQRDKRIVKGWEAGIPSITFNDIGGLEDVKSALKEAYELPLVKGDLLQKLNVQPIKGILLYGPPGNGKTLLAKAVANEVSANFFTLSGADIAKNGATQAASTVKEMFNLAKDNAPSIIFLDELDQLAPDRSNPQGSDFVSVTTELLGELDGIKDLRGVMVLAATNRPDSVDQALLRSNRIEKHLLVPAPNESARKQILDICLKGVNSKDLSVDDLVKMTDGYSGAEINELVNSAKKALIAESVGGSTRDWLTMDDFKTAIDKKEKETLPTNGSSPRGF